MADLDIQALLSPLEGESPCGPDLEYDAAFRALEEAGAGKPERQYGDSLIPAEPPDWPVVYQQAVALAGRTRDLRIATWLVRAGARVHGIASGVAGLELAAGLVEQFWTDVHPKLDAEDGNDPTARLSALSPLVHPGAALADLRAASLTGAKGSLTVRDLELAFGRAEVGPGESALSEEGVATGVAAAIEQHPKLKQTLLSAETAVRRMATVIDQHVGASDGVDFKPLVALASVLTQAVKRASGEAADLETDGAAGIAAARSGASMPGAIATREDAIKALDRVCDWIARHEPSNPAPLLIRRAQRLMSKDFLEIIRDLVPEGLAQVEKLAGIQNDQ